MKGKTMSIPNTIQARLSKDRAMTSITLRIPQDVVDSLKTVAPKRGFVGYQTLLKSYISDGLRRDEAQFLFDPSTRLLAALRKCGVPQSVLDEAARELEAA